MTVHNGLKGVLINGVSRVWPVGHVPWAPLEVGDTERF